MYQIFHRKSNINYSVMRLPEIEYLKRIYVNEVNRLIDYYHDSTFSIKSNHLLARLLTNLTSSNYYEIDRYVEVVRARAPYVASGARLTSELSSGNFFAGVFYGPSCNEIIFNDDEYFNPFIIENNWRNIKAVRVVTHPYSNLLLMLPDGNKNNTGEGLSVVTVNLALLAVQFRSFMLDQMATYSADNQLLSAPHFIMRYVLPNMLPEQIDLSILNRMMNLFYGRPMDEALKHQPITITNYSDRVDNILKKLLKVLADRRVKYEAMLNFIPSIFNNSIQDTLLLPDIALTKQVNWAIMLSRLNIVKFLVDLGGANGVRFNRGELNQLKKYLDQLMNENIIENKLPRDLAYDIGNIINELVRK